MEKVLMLNGSPRANGNIALAFHEMEQVFDELGVAHENILLGRQAVRGCVACESCRKTEKCAFDDIVNDLAGKFESADGLVIGSPVYYGSANGTLMSALQRLFYSTSFDKSLKVGALFMFVILPDGFQVMGAGIATMLSNVASLVYFLTTYRRVRVESVLEIPRRIERIRPESRRNIFTIGVPAALSVFLFDLTNIVINRLSASHGDIELAAIGIVQKVERFPLNIGIGICLGMIPLIGYNYASGNHRRMSEFFTAARIAGLAVAAVSVLMYYLFADRLITAFIADTETVRLGTAFLRAWCFATPFMFLSFNMVNFMQAVNRGRESFLLAAIRQIGLNIPILFLMNALFGMMGIVWTQAVADIVNVIISYIIYARVIREI